MIVGTMDGKCRVYKFTKVRIGIYDYYRFMEQTNTSTPANTLHSVDVGTNAKPVRPLPLPPLPA